MNRAKDADMNRTIRLLEVVALVEDLPQEGLYRGQVGTVVEVLAPGVFLVEFSDPNGRTYAMVDLRTEQLMPLIHERIRE